MKQIKDVVKEEAKSAERSCKDAQLAKELALYHKLIRDAFKSMYGDNEHATVEFITDEVAKNPNRHNIWNERGRPTSLILVQENDDILAYVDASYGRLVLLDKITKQVDFSIPSASVIVTEKYVMVWKDYYGVTTELYKRVD